MKMISLISAAIGSRRFWIGFLLGQVLAICITVTNYTTRVLTTEYNYNIPTTQSFCLYVLLGIVYTIISYYKYRDEFIISFQYRWWCYIFVAFVDVEANYFIARGFSHTSFLSAMTINSCSIPGVLFVSFVFLKTKYEWNHLLGVVISIIGLIILIGADILSDKSYPGSSPFIGNIFCCIAALLYSSSNVMIEFFSRLRPFEEILAMVGIFGSMISGLQLAILDREELNSINWESNPLQVYILFTVAMFTLYSLFPIHMKLTNATYSNISLLTNGFYGVILGLFLFPDDTFHPLYPFAYLIVLIGLFLFNLTIPLTPYNRSIHRQSYLPHQHQSETVINLSTNHSNRDLTQPSPTSPLSTESP